MILQSNKNLEWEEGECRKEKNVFIFFIKRAESIENELRFIPNLGKFIQASIRFFTWFLSFITSIGVENNIRLTVRKCSSTESKIKSMKEVALWSIAMRKKKSK